MTRWGTTELSSRPRSESSHESFFMSSAIEDDDHHIVPSIRYIFIQSVLFFLYWGVCCGLSLGDGRVDFAVVGIALYTGLGLDSAAFEDDELDGADPLGAGAFGGGGLGAYDLGSPLAFAASFACPRSKSSTALFAPSVSPMDLYTSLAMFGSMFGVRCSFHRRCPLCASCSARLTAWAILPMNAWGSTTLHCVAVTNSSISLSLSRCAKYTVKAGISMQSSNPWLPDLK